MPPSLLEFFIALQMEERKHTHTPENQQTTLFFFCHSITNSVLVCALKWETRKSDARQLSVKYFFEIKYRQKKKHFFSDSLRDNFPLEYNVEKKGTYVSLKRDAYAWNYDLDNREIVRWMFCFQWRILNLELNIN